MASQTEQGGVGERIFFFFLLCFCRTAPSQQSELPFHHFVCRFWIIPLRHRSSTAFTEASSEAANPTGRRGNVATAAAGHELQLAAELNVGTWRFLEPGLAGFLFHLTAPAGLKVFKGVKS